MELGIDLLKAAGGLLPGLFGPGGGGAPGTMPAPGAGTTAPGAPGAIVTTQVSPAIQTRISPQISPTMTQIQSSPGAGVIAAPQQIAPGGQEAITPMTGPSVPGVPTEALPPPPTYTSVIPRRPPEPVSIFPSPIPAGAIPTAFQTGAQKIDWTMIAVAGGAVIALIAIFGQRRKR